MEGGAMNAYEVIAICILTIIACAGFTYGIMQYADWRKQKRELLELRKRWLEKQLKQEETK